jgi:hypothetical protein
MYTAELRDDQSIKTYILVWKFTYLSNRNQAIKDRSLHHQIGLLLLFYQQKKDVIYVLVTKRFSFFIKCHNKENKVIWQNDSKDQFQCIFFFSTLLLFTIRLSDVIFLQDM